MQCTRHDGKDMVMVCTTCENELVCVMCIAIDHQGHNFSVLSEVQSKKREKLRKLISTVELVDVVKLRNKIGVVQMKRTTNKRISSNFYTAIDGRGNKIKSAIDEVVQKVIEGSADIEKRHDDLLRTCENKLRYCYSGMVSFIKHCREGLEQASYEEMVDWEKQLKEQLAESEAIDTIPDIRFPQLTDGSLSPDTLSKVVGLAQLLLLERQKMVDVQFTENPFVTVNHPICESPAAIEIVSSFTHGSDDIRVVCSVGSNAWLGCYTKNISLVEKEGNIVCQVSLDCFTNDMTRCANGSEILLSCFDGTVRKIFQDGSEEVVFRNADRVHCLTVLGEDEILLGMLGKLTRCSMKGEILQVLEEQKNGQYFVTFPHKLSVNPVTSDIVVVNWDPNEIIVFDKFLSLKVRYRGEADLVFPSLNVTSTKKIEKSEKVMQASLTDELKEAVMTREDSIRKVARKVPDVVRTENPMKNCRTKKFHPYDVSFDDKGYMHVVDYDSRAIQILNSNGDFLKTLKICKEGIVSLDFDNYGTLWLGGRKGSVKIVKTDNSGTN